MPAEPKFTASKQNGEPGSCFLAQVFGPSGEAIAQFEPTSPPGTASRYARLLADVLNAPQHTDVHALAEDIKASIAELAGGRSFPDLLAAVDELAGFAVQVEKSEEALPSSGERESDESWPDDDDALCERCKGDGRDPMTDYLLPCPACQSEQH